MTDEIDYSEVSPYIMIEVNSFTEPVPFSSKSITSYVADFIQVQDREDLVKQYELFGFLLNTLDVERTLIEKITGIVKNSYMDNRDEIFKNKIRHFYDVSLILRDIQYVHYLRSEKAVSLLGEVVVAEGNFPGKMNKEWVNRPLSQAPLFEHSETIIPRLANFILGNFSKMVFDKDVPDESELKTVFSCVSDCLQRFDVHRGLIRA